MSFGFSKKRNPRLWFGRGTHSGTRQTILAQQAGPLPAIPSLGLLVLGFFIFKEIFIPVAVVLVILWFLYAYFYNKKNYLKEWVCSKCGYFFEPEKLYLDNINTRSIEISKELIPLSYLLYYPKTENERNESIKRAKILLQEIEKIGKIDAIKNFDKLKNDIILINDLGYVLLQLDKADKSFFRIDKKNEVNSLVEALHSLIKIKITNEKFDSFCFVSAITNKAWTVKYLKKRLVDAGYIPPHI